jgi:hypothetical protein
MQVGVYQRNGASWRRAEGIDVIRSAHWLGRHTGASSSEIGNNISALRRSGRHLTVFQSPLLLGLVNYPEIVDARIRLGGLPGTNKIGNSNRR